MKESFDYESFDSPFSAEIDDELEEELDEWAQWEQQVSSPRAYRRKMRCTHPNDAVKKAPKRSTENKTHKRQKLKKLWAEWEKFYGGAPTRDFRLYMHGELGQTGRKYPVDIDAVFEDCLDEKAEENRQKIHELVSDFWRGDTSDMVLGIAFAEDDDDKRHQLYDKCMAFTRQHPNATHDEWVDFIFNFK